MSAIKKYSLLGASLFVLAACSSSNSNNQSNPNILDNITVSTPNIIPNLPGNNIGYTGYVLVTNNSINSINNLSYQIANPIGNVENVTIESTSVNKCSTLSANASCTLKVNLTNNDTGSFSIELGQTSSSVSSFTRSSTTTSSNTIGIEHAIPNNESNADGVRLYFANTVLPNTKNIVVTGIVSSPQATGFNNVTLVDSNNNPIPNQTVLSGNLGAGMTTLSLGSIFSIVIPAPANGSNQSIYAQTSYIGIDGTQSNIHTSTQSSGVINTLTNNQAIVSIVPSAIILNESSPSRVITISNSGNLNATNVNLTTSDSNLTITPGSTTISPNGSTTATISLIHTVGTSTNSSVLLNYNNGISNLSSNFNVIQQLTPSIEPTAGLLAVLLPNSDFIKTTKSGAVTRQLTITNTGNTLENDFTLSGLPDGFTISNGSSNSCTLSGNTISNELSSASSCTLTLSYDQTAVTPNTIGTLTINYKYNNGIQSETPATINFNYEVEAATANLNFNPTSHQFTNIVSNNTESDSYVFTLTNTGDENASNIQTIISGTNPNMFTVNNTLSNISNACTTILNAGESCQVGVVFGPNNQEINSSQSAYLNAKYDNVPSITTNTLTESVVLTGMLVAPESANINISLLNANNFAGGNGSNATPYQIQTNTVGTITYRITNSGNSSADGFYTNIGTLSSDWTTSSNTCGESTATINLSSNSSCNIIFQINDPTSGANNFNENIITAYWSDDKNLSGISKTFSGITYVNVFNAPNITITPINNIVLANSTNNARITLSDGYNVPNQTIQFAPSTPSSQSITYSNNPCSVSSESSTCTISVNIGESIAEDTYTINITNTSGNVPLSINQMVFRVVTTFPLHIPQTGQTPTLPQAVNESYDGYYYYGVAWAYVTSGSTTPESRFTVGTDAESNCLYDNLTGLMWPKNGSLFSSADSFTNNLNKVNAMNTDTNNVNYNLCGYTDWRMANINELRSLINYSTNASPTWLGTQGFTNIQNTYMSSSIAVYDGNRLWTLSMNSGGTDKGDNNYALPVRGTSTTANLSPVPQTYESPTAPATNTQPGSDGMVRAGVPLPEPRFVKISDDKCIIDLATGLIWVRDMNAYPIPTGLTNEPSFNNTYPITQYMNTVGYCGFNDWRVPNANEIYSLVNYGISDQATWLTSQGFLNILSGRNYWSNTIDPSQGSARMLAYNSGNGRLNNTRADRGAFLLPVRGMTSR